MRLCLWLNCVSRLSSIPNQSKTPGKSVFESKPFVIWIKLSPPRRNRWGGIRTKALLRVTSSLFCRISPSQLLAYPRLGLLSCWSSQTKLPLLGWLQMMNHFYTVSNAVCQRRIQSATFCFSLNTYNNKKETTSPGEKRDTISHHQWEEKWKGRKKLFSSSALNHCRLWNRGESCWQHGEKRPIRGSTDSDVYVYVWSGSHDPFLHRGAK